MTPITKIEYVNDKYIKRWENNNENELSSQILEFLILEKLFDYDLFVKNIVYDINFNNHMFFNNEFNENVSNDMFFDYLRSKNTNIETLMIICKNYGLSYDSGEETEEGWASYGWSLCKYK